MKRFVVVFMIVALTFFGKGNAVAQESGKNSGPVLQNTFHGLTLGNEYTVDAIKAAVGKKSASPEDVNVSFDGDGKRIIFGNVLFGGTKWNLCEIVLSCKEGESKGVFYLVRHYNTYSDFLFEDSDDKKEMTTLYERLSGVLDKKYGNGTDNEKNCEDHAFRYYTGGNDVSATLYYDRMKSEGGSYLHYIGLTYYVRSIREIQHSSAIDEL